MCASIASREIAPTTSGCARENPKPAEVVASALKPSRCRYTALPSSQGLGRTKHPDSCSARNAATASEAADVLAAIGDPEFEANANAPPRPERTNIAGVRPKIIPMTDPPKASAGASAKAEQAGL